MLFRLISTGRVKDPDLRRELVEDVYALGAQARNPVALADVLSWTDTSSWSVSRAAALELDTLSIRCRAVKAMLTQDPQRARQMFLDISMPALESPKCETALVQDPSIYYDTARELADRGLIDLGATTRSITSATELAAAARALRVMRGTGEERRLLLEIYAGRLAEISDSDRAASLALASLRLPQELVKLAETYHSQGIGVDGLLAAYRKFLARQAAGPRCADSKIQAAAGVFNDRLRWGGYLATQDLPRLSEADLKPASMDRRAAADQYWRTDQSKHLLSAIRHLRFGDGASPLAASQMASGDWQAQAKTLLNGLEAWQADLEPTPADSFHERATLYSSLLDLMPNSPLRETVARSAISFLADSTMKTESPAEWLLELQNLLGLKDRDAIQKVARASKDPAIRLYASVSE